MLKQVQHDGKGLGFQYEVYQNSLFQNTSLRVLHKKIRVIRVNPCPNKKNHGQHRKIYATKSGSGQFL